MNKVMGIIGFWLAIICTLACVINVFVSIDTYSKNKERIEVLETELSAALGYDITNPPASSGESNEDTSTGDTSGSYDTSMFKKIGAKDLASLSNGKTIVVWIGRQGCGYCSLYAPRIHSVGKSYNVPVYYIDLGTIFDFSGTQVTIKDQAAYDTMLNFQTDAENADVLDNFGSTPMTLFIRDNKIVGNIIGALDESQIEQTFKDEGFKK